MLEAEIGTERSHYDVLQVRRTATKEEIRSSFRRLVKIYHPDKNPKRIPWAEARMRELLRAYEIVSDEERRLFYDQKVRNAHARVTFADRIAKKDDPRSQSKLVLHHLLEGQFDEALALHERLRLRWATFSLAHHLDECDYLDTLFLLGEAYETRRQWRTAARYYWEAYERESTGARKRYFFEELRDRLRILFSQRLVQGLAPEDALKSYQRALPLCIGNREAALIYKKIALVQIRLGSEEEAIRALDRAQKLCPRMKTIQLMREKIAGT